MDTKQFNALMQIIAKLSSEVTLLAHQVAQLASRVNTLEESIVQLRKDMEQGFADIRAEMAAEFKNVRAEMAAEFANVRQEAAADFADIRREMKHESKKQAAVHDEILQAFNAPFQTLEHDHVATKSNHGKRITKLERHIG